MKQNSTDILRKRAELGLQQITQGRCYTTQDVISVCRDTRIDPTALVERIF